LAGKVGYPAGVDLLKSETRNASGRAAIGGQQMRCNAPLAQLGSAGDSLHFLFWHLFTASIEAKNSSRFFRISAHLTPGKCQRKCRGRRSPKDGHHRRGWVRMVPMTTRSNNFAASFQIEAFVNPPRDACVDRLSPCDMGPQWGRAFRCRGRYGSHANRLSIT
jgi:hypothetical protein